MKNRLILILIVAGLLAKTDVFGQATNRKTRDWTNCQQKDIWEVLFRKQPKPPDTSRKLHTFFMPYLGLSPTKGLQLGVGGTLTWYMGKSPLTNQSAASATIEFTTKNQKMFQLKSNVYLDRNQWFLQGDWRFYLYTLPTFGLGTGYNNPIPLVPGLCDTASQFGWDQKFQTDFTWLKLHETFSRRIIEDIYIGVGYHLDYHYNIEDKDLVLDSSGFAMTPHYAYSVLHEINPEKYVSSGISLNFVFDTRDNLINPYSGYYVNLNYRINSTIIGSTCNGSQLWAEFRTYVGLEKKLPRHLIAFWLYGGFQVSGTVPYFDLYGVSFDQMNSSGRGYIQGRWRGQDLAYAEVEYRFPITRCNQVLGGVFFVNATSASSRDQGIQLFQTIRPAAGVGLRIMVSKTNRTNILIDFTIGEQSKGVYFSAQEAF
jgi:hypothetical protein